jgi:hypothetical protein
MFIDIESRHSHYPNSHTHFVFFYPVEEYKNGSFDFKCFKMAVGYDDHLERFHYTGRNGNTFHGKDMEIKFKHKVSQKERELKLYVTIHRKKQKDINKIIRKTRHYDQ